MRQSEISTLSTFGEIFINRCVVERSTEYHSHNYIEIAYTAEGKGRHIIADNEYKTKVGDIAIINYDTAHRFISEGDLLIYNCVFTTDFLDRMLPKSRDFNDLGSNFLVSGFYGNIKDSVIVNCDSSSNADILRIYVKMLEEYENRKLGSKEMIRGYLIELLVLIFRSLNKEPSVKNIYSIIEHIDKNFNKQMSVRDLANLGGFSVTSFHRKFKTATGCTFNEYVQRLRVFESCNLLMSTDKKVIEIAGLVGYSDMKHFYDIFKRHTGNVPKSFRCYSQQKTQIPTDGVSI